MVGYTWVNLNLRTWTWHGQPPCQEGTGRASWSRPCMYAPAGMPLSHTVDLQRQACKRQKHACTTYGQTTLAVGTRAHDAWRPPVRFMRAACHRQISNDVIPLSLPPPDACDTLACVLACMATWHASACWVAGKSTGIGLPDGTARHSRRMPHAGGVHAPAPACKP